MTPAERAEIEALAQQAVAELHDVEVPRLPAVGLHGLRCGDLDMTRLRAALDLACWPIFTTVCAILPRRLGRWLREPPEPEVVA